MPILNIVLFKFHCHSYVLNLAKLQMMPYNDFNSCCKFSAVMLQTNETIFNAGLKDLSS